MLCFLKGMAIVPFLLVTWSSAAFIISYVVAVVSGHVNPFLPYISDTGTTPPESGIFGFMINFSAFLGAATMYTRYKIVEKQNETCYFSTPVFNLLSLVLGLLGCIGMGIVANFQELAVPVVHDGGALLAFVCGVVYTLLQSVISYKSCPQWNSLTTCHVRMAISAISCAAVVPMIACGSLISITKLEWNPKEKDYVYHIVSAICEWTVAFGFIFYFLTFIQDFQNLQRGLGYQPLEDNNMVSKATSTKTRVTVKVKKGFLGKLPSGESAKGMDSMGCSHPVRAWSARDLSSLTVVLPWAAAYSLSSVSYGENFVEYGASTDELLLSVCSSDKITKTCSARFVLSHQEGCYDFAWTPCRKLAI
ncbi:hypothetical protein STEG23_018355, partial [Scotinomys teguina]